MYTDKSIFLIKKEKKFIKYMEILEKVNNIIKNKLNSKLIYSKKMCKSWKKQQNKTKKHTHTKGGFQCLSAPII